MVSAKIQIIHTRENLFMRPFRHEVLTDPYQVSALKGFLAPPSLVHPENPLRQEGHDGLELWMGQVESVTRFKSESLTCNSRNPHQWRISSDVLFCPNRICSILL